LRGFVLFQIVFWGAFFAMRAIAATVVMPIYFWSYMTPRLIIVATYAAVTTGIHMLVIRYPNWTTMRRLWLTLALCALALAPMYLLENALTRSVAPNWPNEKFLDYISKFGWALLAWAGYHFAQDYARAAERQALALAEAQALAHAAQLKMLRYQLNPHFLFNSLNAISALVLEGRNKDAEAMLMRLSRFLRHTIDTDPTQLARLGDEAQLQRLYLEMETVRFGERLCVNCNIPASLHDCLVPTLLLQPIVENAIKHGVSKTAGSGHISISASAAGERLILQVENDGPPYAPPAPETGVGLRNTADRLRAAYGGDARLEVESRPEGGVRARLDLPLMRAQ
jgi:two-component system, LytTR family, sensor kinase